MNEKETQRKGRKKRNWRTRGKHSSGKKKKKRPPSDFHPRPKKERCHYVGPLPKQLGAKRGKGKKRANVGEERDSKMRRNCTGPEQKVPGQCVCGRAKSEVPAYPIVSQLMHESYIPKQPWWFGSSAKLGLSYQHQHSVSLVAENPT